MNHNAENIPTSPCAKVIAAIMEPTKDSNKSALIPATSPTLSPTLSAITAGLRGSSSGMSISTLPTKSAPFNGLINDGYVNWRKQYGISKISAKKIMAYTSVLRNSNSPNTYQHPRLSCKCLQQLD